MIRGLYRTDVVSVRPETSLKEVATLMRDRHVGDVVVVDSQQAGQQTSQGKTGLIPIGILTDRDLVVNCLAEDSTSIENLKVRDVMSRNIVFVGEDAELFDTIREMRKAGVGRILVVDSNRFLLGILTAQTIFDLLNEELHELGLIARTRRAPARYETLPERV